MCLLIYHRDANDNGQDIIATLRAAHTKHVELLWDPHKYKDMECANFILIQCCGYNYDCWPMQQIPIPKCIYNILCQ